MIIVMRPDTTKGQLDHLLKRIKKLGLKPWVSKGVERTIVGVIGEEDVLRIQPLEAFPGVEKVLAILKPFKLASRDFRKEPTVVDIGGGVRVGGKKVVVMAGPCSVENEKLLIDIAKKVLVGKQDDYLKRHGGYPGKKHYERCIEPHIFFFVRMSLVVEPPQ